MTEQNPQTMSANTDPFYEFRKLVAFGHLFLAIFSTTLIVFLRHRFGQRYLNSFTFGLAFVLIMLVSVFGADLAEGTNLEEGASSGTGWLMLYGWAFLILGAWHAISARLRARQGERWHSWCPGISHLMKILPFNLYTTHRYVEPAFGAIAGFLIMKTFSAPLGGFIVWSAAALFLVETIAARQAKSFLLDSIDQQIEQENMAASLIEQKPLRETHGFTVMGAEILNQDSRTKLASAATRLDPELQDLLGAQKA